MRDFVSVHAAMSAMHEHLNNHGEYCIDNERFAFLDDESGIKLYEESERSGCCGYYDEEVTIRGRPAKMGCNYGH